MVPSWAADSGLPDDAARVPSFTPDAVAALVARLDARDTELRSLDWDALSRSQQVDVRWLLANIAMMKQQLTVEKRWDHRPSEWLEPVANTFIGLTTYAPDRVDIRAHLAALLPAMVAEMEELVRSPTARDVDTAKDILGGLRLGIEALPPSADRDAALAALERYELHLSMPADLPEFKVIGADAYAWRLQHAMLSPWTPAQLLRVAETELAAVEAEMTVLEEAMEPAAEATADELKQARELTKEGLLGLYEDMVQDNLTALRRMDVMTIPADLPAIKARETPDALVPLTGDGGSMNPPPLFGAQSVGWWNVEHFSPDWPEERRLRSVMNSRRQQETWYGPYAVHEGVPGHHLQLALARSNPNPIRTLLTDNAGVEGWGLYAEQLFQENGGFGDAPAARYAMLRSYRYRIRRVIYDVKVETEVWSLQQAADFKDGPGAEVGPEILRTVQWPTQLIGYFHGKKQIVDLRAEMQQAQGARYTHKAFHDAVVGAGLIPVSLVRAELLDLPVPAP